MKPFSRAAILASALASILTVPGCEDETPVVVDIPVLKPFPELPDTLPFDRLGSGKLFFSRRAPGVRGGFYLVDIDRQSAEIAAGPDDPSSGGVYGGPVVSPDGTTFAYLRYGGYPITSWDLRTQVLDGGATKEISAMEEIEHYPSWSPDSSRLLFFYDFSPTWLISIDKSGDRTSRDWFKLDLGVVGAPCAPRSGGPAAISDDGTIVIALQGWCESVNITGLYTVSLTGGKPSLLVAGGVAPVFSPDGETIAYSRGTAIGLTDKEALNQREIPLPSGLYLRPWERGRALCWSPDGTMLLFSMGSRDSHGQSVEDHLYVVNADGSELTQVTYLDGAQDGTISWF